MKTVNEMNLQELKEHKALLEECQKERYELFKDHGSECLWTEQLEELTNMIFEVNNLIRQKEAVTIYVTFETGYKWSVYLSNEDESRQTLLNKVDAVSLARHINKEEFQGKANLSIETLSKKEKAENMSWLHAETLTYDKEYRNYSSN